MDSRQFFIDGTWCDSDGGTPYQVIDPASEQPVTTITLGTRADVDKAVAAARRAFGTFSRTSVEERKALLARVIDGYKARIPDLAAATAGKWARRSALRQPLRRPPGSVIS